MKKTLVLVVLVGVNMGAHAQGYVGAVAALTSVGLDCSGQVNCDKRGFGVKLYAGTKLKPSSQMDLGFGKIDAVEVGVINFGKASSQSTASYIYEDPILGLVPVNRQVNQVATANALFAAAVLNMPITSDFSVGAKLGVAYVSSTVRRYVDGGANGSETATKLKPYIGLAASYNLMDAVRLVGSYDATRYDVLQHASWLGALGLGAELSF